MLFIGFNAFSQDADFTFQLPELILEKEVSEPQLYCFCEWEAEFPGGVDSLVVFIERNLVYPNDAINANIEGKVLIEFVVEKDGSLSSAKVERGLYASLDNEALRLVELMPNWRPAGHAMKNEPFRTRVRLPIIFVLKD